MSWYVQIADPPKTTIEDEILDELAVSESAGNENRLEDEEEDEETEDRSWRR